MASKVSSAKHPELMGGGSSKPTAAPKSAGSTSKNSPITQKISNAKHPELMGGTGATSGTTSKNSQRKSNNEYQKQKDKKNQGKSSTGGKNKNQKQSIYSSDDSKESRNQGKDGANYLAETVEDGVRNQPQKIYSGGEEAKKPEQRGQQGQQQIYSANQEDADMDAKWAELEGQAKEKNTHKENARNLDNEIDRLLNEKAATEGLSVEEADQIDQQIKALREQSKAEHKAAGDKTLSEKWQDLKYDPNNWTGKDEWAFLDRDQQTDNLAGGWGRQYIAGPVMTAGTGLQWFDQASDDMVRYEYDLEHGAGAYDRAIAGKNVNQIGQLGNKLWDTGTGLQQTGEEMWAEGTKDMSDTGKQIANVAKTGMDVVGDIALNAVTPGMGTMRMYLGAAGNAAYEQSQRENNDIDSRAVAALKGGLNAYLSNILVGGLDSAYGESVLGKQVHEMLGKTSPEVQTVLKPLLNTEGIEEGLEDILNHVADRVLGLETGQPLDWNEVKQDAAIGYILGVLTNGLAGGMNIDSKTRHNIGDGSIEFVGLVEQTGDVNQALDQAAEIGKQNTRDQVVLKATPEAEQQTPAEPKAGTEPAPEPAPAEPEANTPTFNNSMDTGAQTETHQRIRDALSGGAVSEQDITRILATPASRQAFKDVTGISLDGMDYETARNTVGMAAGSVPPQANTAPQPARSSNETIAAIQERGTISPREASRIQRDPKLRAAFEDAYNIKLPDESETRATEKIINTVNEKKLRERQVTGEFFEVPAAEPGFNEGPGEPGSKERKEYNRAMKARQDVADILAQESLSRKDATRLMSDKIMWQAFVDATDIDLKGKPRTEQNIREAFKEAKANMPAEPEPIVEPKTIAEPVVNTEQTTETPVAEATAKPESDLQTQLQEAEAELDAKMDNLKGVPGEWTQEITDLYNRVNNLRTQLGLEPYVVETETNNANPEANTERDTTTPPQANANENQSNSNEKPTEKKRKTDHSKQVLNPDENTDAEFDKLVEEHGPIEKGENPARDINVPKKDTTGKKVSESIRTIMEAKATPDSRLEDIKAAVVNGDFGHVPVTNDARSKRAYEKLTKDGWSRSVGEFLRAAESGQVDADMVALGAHLINEAGNSPDFNGREYIELMTAYKEAATDAGQRLAANRILKTLTPEGRLYGILKATDEINKGIKETNDKRAKKGKKQKPEVKLNEELAEKFLKAKTEEERSEAYDAIIKDVADQTPNTLRDKFTALRYLNMLGNVKTQSRNLAGNLGMTLIQKVKNETVSVIEGLRSATHGGKTERTYKGLYKPELFKVGLEEIKNPDLRQEAMGEAKFSDVKKQATSEIQNAKKPFSDKNPFGWLLNKYSKATNWAMEFGDQIFVTYNYADALAGYLNANNITAADWKAMVADPKKAADVDKARAYAIKQAQEATFRDTNAISKAATQFDKNWKLKFASQGVLPFRKTTANVFARMEEYGPLGLVNTVYDAVQTKNGKANANDVIDSLAKTLTGSGLLVAGFFMRRAGKARTKDKDDNEEKLAKLRGQQDYSIEVTGKDGKPKSITMDWLTPAAASFFMGCELYDIFESGQIKPAQLMTVLSSFTNPMLEMSLLSGVNDALDTLSDFEGDNSAVVQFVLNSAWSYLTQGISNTLAGQAEQFSEDYRQTYYTTSDEDSFWLNKAAQKKLAKLFNKTPGKDFQAADYIDAWGRKQENEEDLVRRAWNVFANPAYVSDLDDKATEVDSLIEGLYQYGKEQTDHDTFPNVVPRTPSRYTTVNGTQLTPEEYDEYAITKGQESLNAIIEASQTDAFKNADKYTQAETIKDIYSYSEFLAAAKIAESRGEKYYDEKFTPLLTGQKEDGENTYKAPIKEADIPEYLGFMNAYNDAMSKKDYGAVDALIDSAKTLPKSARAGATQRAKDMEKLSDMKEAGLSDVKTYYQFQNDMREIYESEKRSDAKSTDYIRVAGSGKYSAKDADAIMGYERKVSEASIARYQERVKYSLDKAGKSGLYDAAWSNIEKCANGDMTTDQFNKWVEKNVPLKYRQNIKDVRSTYASDKHVAGKQVSGIYRAVREAGYTPQQALQFFNMIDKNYNDSYTKHEINTAVAKAFGYDSKYNKRYYGKTYTYYNFSGYAKKVRDGITKYAGK